MRTSREIRVGFREFFRARGHEVVKSAPIVPENDPSLMFTNAGMVPFKDVFTGKEKRRYKAATSAQKCLRISGKHNDLENVGVTARHHTFFEMLGNFSFGGYFKEQAIRYAWELFAELGVDPDRLIVTVFGGEGELAPDTEAEGMWRDISGLARGGRIVRLGAADNFWQMGDTGPCGPCSEIHYFFGPGEPDPALFGQEPSEDGRGWMEVWNLVFMQFERRADGGLDRLPKPSIDTGVGLERLSAVVQGVCSNYDTDLFRPLIEAVAGIAKKRYTGSLSADDISVRVIADHARAAAFLIAEGVFPDRDGRAYVLRRVMRRAIRHGHRLGIERSFLHECACHVIALMGEEYPELQERRAVIQEIIQQEEERFRHTLRRGLERLETYVWPAAQARVLPGAVAFELYDSYGFPYDLQELIGREQSFAIDHAGFEAMLDRARARSAGSKVGDEGVAAVHRSLAHELPEVEFTGYEHEHADSTVAALLHEGATVSRLEAGQAGELIVARTPFYAESGGQVGDRGVIATSEGRFIVEDTQRPVPGLVVHCGRVEQGSLHVLAQCHLEVDHATRAATRRNHSAAHLLHLALRGVLGPHAIQKGSRIGPERLRFDYSCTRAPQPDQLVAIECFVNERTLRAESVSTEVVTAEEGKRRGAIAIFEEKYGERVRMLRVADSIELCGGTHVRSTGEIGLFKIVSESGLAAGVRRIEAVTGQNAVRYCQQLERSLDESAQLLSSIPNDVPVKIGALLKRQQALSVELERLKRQLIAAGSRDLAAAARQVDGVQVLGVRVEVPDLRAMRDLADRLRDRLTPAVVVLGAVSPEGKVMLVCTVSQELTRRWKAGELIQQLAAVIGGDGGGRPDFAQAGGGDPSRLDAAVGEIYQLVSA